jgi:ribosomal protein S18 acetylase RimI-like enzyme
MTPLTTVPDVMDALARDPLRHIVLLKQLLAYPAHVKVHRVSGAAGTATLVALDTSVSPYDRQAYPKAAIAAFISSDHHELTASLMPHVPQRVGIMFKLSSEADLAAVESHFPVTRRTAFVSFTSAGKSEPSPGVRVTPDPGDAAFRMFETQGHDRAWLKPLLHDGKAFACVLERDGDAVSACLAFENYGPAWEVGGVVTAPSHRRQGLGARVVRTALAELAGRGLAPRYQVEEHNTASIALARSVGLVPFLTIVHYAHEC